jgi:lysophospholipase L1-like esterase/chitodextrinase
LRRTSRLVLTLLLSGWLLPLVPGPVAAPALADPDVQAAWTLSSDATIDLLLVGNSITQGFPFSPGYRDDLHLLLGGEPEHTFIFVGSSGSPPLQGHFQGGTQICEFYPPGFGNGWGTGTFDTTPDLGPPGTPDMVAIHLGTNDLNSAPPPFAPYSLDHGQTLNPSQAGELAEYILYLLQWQNGPQSLDLTHLVLSMIIPIDGRIQDVEDFNNSIIAMSEDFGEGTVTGSPVRITLADHYNHFLSNPDLFTFGPGDWMSDALHPNDEGYTEMAGVYHGAIVESVDDATPPDPVTDLAIIAVDSTRVDLAFTTPGDDGMTGRAFRYDLRVSTGDINSGNFGFSTQAEGEPAPAPAGAPDTLEVRGLLPGTTYTFALKLVDDAGNRSTISNRRVATTIGTGAVVLVLREGGNGYAGTEDNSLIDTRNTDNWGSADTIGVGQHGSGPAGALVTDVARSLIRFDVSHIPAGIDITSARLQCFNHIRESSEPVEVAAYRVTKHWVEGTRTAPSPQNGASCWDDAQLGILPWSAPGVSSASDQAQNNDPDFDRYATPEDTAILTDEDVWYEWDLTRAVEEWISGNWNNDGVLLEVLVEGPNTRRTFYSSESTTNQALRPTLVVTYLTGSTNSPPIANAGGPYSGAEQQAIAFDGSRSFDPEGQPITYDWDFGDGNTGSGPTPTHAYALPGLYTVTLVVNDGDVNSLPDETLATVSGGAAIEEPPAGAPLATRLHGAYPNPFAETAAIRYDLATSGHVSLRIYDLKGRLVQVLADGIEQAGSHRSIWDGASDTGHRLPAGVYFARFEAQGIHATRKLLLVP